MTDYLDEIILKISYYELYHDRTGISKGIDLAKSMVVQNKWFSIIGPLTMNSNFNIMYAMIAMPWQC